MDVSPHDAAAARTIKPRSPRFDFSEVPRHWYGGGVVATHLANGVNLLFPAGERFFVRSVHHYADRVRDARLREQVKGFSAQEGRHANAHERYFEALEKQGYRIRGFLRVYETFSRAVMDRLAPPALRLAATAACEHFTATMARNALQDDIFARADPTMRALLMWHACEEVEHKSVAFDVLEEVHPSRGLRLAGLAISGTLLGVWWVAATVLLVRQDRASAAQVWRELKTLGAHNPFGERVYGAAIRAYVRRDFHPDDETRDRELAAAYLENAGIA
jgi:predicted metal-dependent hydrolase